MSNLLRIGSCSTLPRPFAFAALPSRTPNLDYSDPARHIISFLGGHPAVRASCTMGRLDRIGSYNSHRSLQRRDLCYAAHPRLSQSAPEEDSRERGHEWRELLQQSQ